MNAEAKIVEPSAFRVTTVVEFGYERIVELLETAFYGGINHWATVRGYEPKGPFLSSITAVLQGNGKILLQELGDDMNDYTGTQHALGREHLEKGLRLMAEQYAHHVKAFMEENEDAETGDVFVQLAALGEITYG